MAFAETSDRFDQTALVAKPFYIIGRRINGARQRRCYVRVRERRVQECVGNPDEGTFDLLGVAFGFDYRVSSLFQTPNSQFRIANSQFLVRQFTILRIDRNPDRGDIHSRFE